MGDRIADLFIRSRHGMLRDLIPIYSIYQLIPNLLILAFIPWLIVSRGHFPTIGYLVIVAGWVFQFVSRPCQMTVSNEQASWLEAVLAAQKFYDRSAGDGRWRTLNKQAWLRWPHQHIEFVQGDSDVTVIAPRDVMESLRAALEILDDHQELLFTEENRPFSFEPANPETLPRHMHVAAALIGATCVIAWFGKLFTRSHDMIDWGVSGAALSAGRYETIMLHMFAHGGAMHLIMNMTMLAAIGGTLTARLGPVPFNWARFLLLFLLSGLAGAALYLALHPMGTVPMLGASGAIYGLLGLLIRVPVDGGTVLSVRSSRIRRVWWDLVKQNLFLFALLAVMSWSIGTGLGLAWEGHLGGFLFGFFVGPKLLPQGESAPPATASSDTASPTPGCRSHSRDCLRGG